MIERIQQMVRFRLLFEKESFVLYNNFPKNDSGERDTKTVLSFSAFFVYRVSRQGIFFAVVSPSIIVLLFILKLRKMNLHVLFANVLQIIGINLDKADFALYNI